MLNIYIVYDISKHVNMLKFFLTSHDNYQYKVIEKKPEGNIFFGNQITHLTFPRRFNKSVNGLIPNSVTHLKFGDNFNSSVGEIPFVRFVIFGHDFNQPLSNKTFGTDLKYLKFGCHFNYPVSFACVTYLIFGYHFNQPIENAIPESTVYIKFGYLFNQPIKNNIPLSVTRIVFSWCFNQSLEDIPLSVIHLIKP